MTRVKYLTSCEPCGKKLYADRRAAKHALRVLYPTERGRSMNVYPCPAGGDGHHIGHRPGSRTPPTWPIWNDTREQRRCDWCDRTIHFGEPVGWLDDGAGVCLDCGAEAECEAIAWRNDHPLPAPAEGEAS